jgi:hypothetical protein
MRIYCIIQLVVVVSAIIVSVVDGQNLGRRRQRSLTLFQLDHEELLKMDDNPIKTEIQEMEVQVSKVALYFLESSLFMISWPRV